MLSVSLLALAVAARAATSFPAGASNQTVPARVGGPQNFVPKAAFPSGVFKEFFPGFGPTDTAAQPQPKVSDPVAHNSVFPFSLTNPKAVPTINVVDPIVFAPSVFNNEPNAPISFKTNLSTPGSRALAASAKQTILDIANSTGLFANKCDQCLAALVAGQGLARVAPWEAPQVIIDLCNFFKFSAFGSCEEEFGRSSDGDVAVQVLQLADVGGKDGVWICNQVISSSLCPEPFADPLPIPPSELFPKPKPANAKAPAPSGEKPLRILHLSDFHLDPRFSTGSEASCSQFLCCRATSFKTSSPNATVSPAPRHGSFFCDTPYSLAGSLLQAIPKLAAGPHGFDWGIFTGDLVSHDDDHQLGRAYVEYEEVAIFTMIKSVMGGKPVYPTLGNHDTWPQAFTIPLSLGPNFVGNQFSWDYEHVSALWEDFGWISGTAQQFAKTHYAAYSLVTPHGLKIISFNTDFWYRDNWFNYVNTTNPDVSGQFEFMIQQLQEAEDAKQRVWLIGHIPPGWDGFNALPNPSNLFYQIVERYSPHVIAEIFFGHNHDDVFAIYYSNNGTVQNADTALTTSWITPSITPLSNLNSGFRAYDVDPKTFNIIDAYTWFANVSAFPALDNQTAIGAEFAFEYSAREAYGANISWPATAPLNATWWHHVTEQWEANPALVETFTQFQGKSSSKTTNCTSSECVTSKICYARSGSQPIARLCPFGSTFGTVQ